MNEEFYKLDSNRTSKCQEEYENEKDHNTLRKGKKYSVDHSERYRAQYSQNFPQTFSLKRHSGPKRRLDAGQVDINRQLKQVMDQRCKFELECKKLQQRENKTPHRLAKRSFREGNTNGKEQKMPIEDIDRVV